MGEVALTRSARFSGGVGKILLTTFLLLVIFSTAKASQQSANNPKASAPPTGQISGHVYSAETGAPLAKAVVTLVQQLDGDSQRPSALETGSDGSFLFTALGAGKYELSVERCGFISQSFEDSGTKPNESEEMIVLASGQKREGLDFKLLRGGVISGTVTDQDSEPVPGLLVQAMAFPFLPGGGQSSNFSSSARVVTDDLGNFRVASLNPGSYYVIIGNNSSESAVAGNIVYRQTAYPGVYLARDAQRVRVNGGAETPGIHVTVRLEKAFAVRGRVHGTCQSGTGIYCLAFASGDGAFARERRDNGRTDDDGTFELTAMFSGEYAVTAIAFRQSEQFSGRFIGVGHTRVQILDRDAEADVSVLPPAEISGVVLDDASKPLVLRQIQIVLHGTAGADADGSPLEIGVYPDITGSALDSHGHFEIKTIGIGKYVFGLGTSSEQEIVNVINAAENSPSIDPSLMYLKEAICAGRDYAQQPVALSPGMRLSDCKIKIGHDTASINGKVLNGDKGVAGQIVVAIPESAELRRNPRYTLTGRTNREGQFSIAGIIPGDYLIFAVTPNEEQSYYALDFAERNPRDAERATFRPGEAKTFVLKPSSAQ